MQAIRLAQEFQRQFKIKYNYYPYTMKTVQDSKWWNHFVGFSANSVLDGKEEEFIKQLFNLWEGPQKLYPYVLSQEYARKIELRMKESSSVETKKLGENDYIKATFIKMADWAKRNHVSENKLGKFITDPACQMLALRGNFYKPLFFFSKSFLDKYNLTENDVLKKNSIRAFHPTIYDALKISLGDDFID